MGRCSCRVTPLQDGFDFLDGKDDVVYEYDGIFEDVFVHEHPELFVFDGTYTVSE